MAHQAPCGYIEDYSPKATDHWDFTCQTNDNMFLIHTADNTSSRDAGRPTGLPYKTGPFYLVSPFQQPGVNPNADTLKAFPGEAADTPDHA